MIRRPALILALLTALNLLNYLDRLVLAAVLAKVQDDLHLSNLVGGSLATVFLIGYFVTSPVFGSLADRAPRGGRTKLLAAGIAVWSLATIGSGLAAGAASLVVSRVFVGFGEASYATIAPTLIDELAPAGKKGRWMAIFYSATPVGSALGYIVGGAVLHATGSWRAPFYVAGVPGLLLALLCLAVVEPARAPGATAAPTGALPLLEAAKELARVPLYATTVLGYCAYTYGLGGFAFWGPNYLYRRYGMDAGIASSRFGAVTVVAGAIGTFVGGWLGDASARARLARLGPRGAGPPAGDGAAAPGVDDAVIVGNVDICTLSVLLGAPLAALAVFATGARGFFAGAFSSEIALFLLSGPVNVAILRSVPEARRASAMALSIFAIHALGDLWSPMVMGLALDHMAPEWAMVQAPAAFALAAVVWGRLSLRGGEAHVRLT